MEWINLPTAETPADWLAWDEVLLQRAEATPEGQASLEMLWFWESKTPFVVVGYGQKVDLEVNVIDCESKSIPIYRRCSGGGTVVQGPGCLNYALVLEIPTAGPLTTIPGTNAWVMERNRQALSSLISDPVVVRGHTDLAVVRGDRELKFSGNAQRRKRRALLFHGTVLLNFDLSWISRLLRTPSWAPPYRAGRSHGEFVTNTHLSRDAVRQALAQAWEATPTQRPLDRSLLPPSPCLPLRSDAAEAGRKTPNPGVIRNS